MKFINIARWNNKKLRLTARDKRFLAFIMDEIGSTADLQGFSKTLSSFSKVITNKLILCCSLITRVSYLSG